MSYGLKTKGIIIRDNWANQDSSKTSSLNYWFYPIHPLHPCPIDFDGFSVSTADYFHTCQRTSLFD
jgi:hypothetical protein